MRTRPSSHGLVTSAATLMRVRKITFFTFGAKLTHTGVIQDAKFKRREALADLAQVASKK
jgi:hypothetical protein